MRVLVACEFSGIVREANMRVVMVVKKEGKKRVINLDHVAYIIEDDDPESITFLKFMGGGEVFLDGHRAEWLYDLMSDKEPYREGKPWKSVQRVDPRT